MKSLIFYSGLICLVSATVEEGDNMEFKRMKSKESNGTYVMVEKGEAARFEVKKTNESVVKWMKIGNLKEEVLYEYGGPIKSGYSFSCKGNVCVMKIEVVQLEDVGNYKFQEEIRGIIHHTSFEILVGDLMCSFNIKKRVIGRNDCYGVQADKVDRTCRLSFVGSDKYKPIIKGGLVGHQNDELVEAVKMEKEGDRSIWEARDSVVFENDNTTFQTYVLGSSLKSLYSPPHSFTQYALNTTTPHLTSMMMSTSKHNLTCVAIKSSNVKCSYMWIYYHIEGTHQRQVTTKFKRSKLWADEINKKGRYECHALCRLGNQQCTILADSFVFKHPPTTYATFLSIPSSQTHSIFPPKSSYSHQPPVDSYKKSWIEDTYTLTIILPVLLIFIFLFVIYRKRTCCFENTNIGSVLEKDAFIANNLN